MTISKRGHFGLLLLSGALSLQYFVACSGDTEASNGAGGTAGSGGSAPGPSTTGSGGTGPGTTGTGPGTTGTGPGTTGSGATGGFSTTAAPSTTTGSSSSEYLFECGFELSCAPVCSHLGGLGDCGGDAACVENVWDSGESGVILFQSRPGPGGYQADTLLVLLGDGQVLIQPRSRSCPSNELNCDLEALPWSFDDQRRCEAAASFSTQGENCVTVNYSCDDVKASLEGGAGGAGGEAGHAGEAAE